MGKWLDGVVVEWKRLGGIMRYADEFAYNKPSVLIPGKGSLGNLFFLDVPFWTVDTNYLSIDVFFHSRVCKSFSPSCVCRTRGAYLST
jgi:hypothetical protein